MSRVKEWSDKTAYSARTLTACWDAAIDAALDEVSSESYGHDPGELVERIAESLEKLKSTESGLMPEPLEGTIGAYSDFSSNWWGLEDGTLLEISDPRGYMWIKIGGQPAKPDHETVQRMIDARN